MTRKILEDQFSKELIECIIRNIIDLHEAGIKIFSTHIEIQKYIIQMEKNQGYI